MKKEVMEKEVKVEDRKRGSGRMNIKGREARGREEEERCRQMCKKKKEGREGSIEAS